MELENVLNESSTLFDIRNVVRKRLHLSLSMIDYSLHFSLFLHLTRIFRNFTKFNLSCLPIDLIYIRQSFVNKNLLPMDGQSGGSQSKGE